MVRTLQYGLLLFFINSAKADNLFRFLGDNGEVVISQSLSKSDIQRGYEIIDSRSLRIIKSFPPEQATTSSQLTEQATSQKKQKENKRISEKEQEKERQQAVAAQKIVDAYGSKETLIQQRDIDLTYRQTQVDKAMLLLKRSEDNYRILQNKATDQQRNDQKISDNLQKALQAVAREKSTHQYAVNRLKAEMSKTKKEYESQLLQLEGAFAE